MAESAGSVIRAFERLSSADQMKYLQLHAHVDGAMKDIVRLELNQNWETLSSIHRKVLGIWYTNGFVEALFYLGSYFNHSCYPNVCFTCNDAIQKQTFHTLRKIKQDEELTISYIPMAKLDLTRR
jgi:hypothetical protein